MTTLVVFDRLDFERELRTFVATGSDMDPKWCIPQNDGGPAPAVPYATVLMERERQEGYAAHHNVNSPSGAGVQEIVMLPMRGEYSVQWYRAGAFARGDRFNHWFQSSLGIMDASRRGFSVQSLSQLERLDWIPSASAGVRGETAWEDRATLELAVSYWQVSYAEVGFIGRVVIDTLDHEEAGHIVTETVTADRDVTP